MRHIPGQFYIDLGQPDRADTLQTVDPTQLDGQTTFDLADPERVFALLGDGTTLTIT